MSGDQAFGGFKHGWLMRGIYAKESSMGKNDSCKNKGLVNGFGFMESTYTWQCFTSFTEVANKVDGWLDENLKDKTVPEALCYYNMGVRTSDCNYAHDVISLSK